MYKALLVLSTNLVGGWRRFLLLPLLGQSLWIWPQHGCHLSWYPRYYYQILLKKIYAIIDGGFGFFFCWMLWTWSESLARKYSNGIENVRQLEARSCLVLHGVDATQMSQHFFLRTQRFDRIIYNFPHVGFLYKEDSYCQIQLSPSPFFSKFTIISLFIWLILYPEYQTVKTIWLMLLLFWRICC